MSSGNIVRLAVGLRAEDPSAVTALATLRSQMPLECPMKMERYDLWEFHLYGGDGDAVERIAGHYVDLVNPNKHIHYVLHGSSMPPSPQDVTPVWIAISNRNDSDSLTWSEILVSAGYPLVKVRRAVLWGLFYPPSEGPDSSRAKALSVARAVSRSRGLLGNPISQRIELLNPAEQT